MERNEIEIIQGATQRKFEELLKKRTLVAEQVERLNRDLAVISTEIDGCQTVAKLFRFSLQEPHLDLAEPPRTEHDIESGIDVTPVLGRKAPEEGTIKDFVAEHLRKIYPKTVRARNLQEIYEKETGQTIHEKTIGMTLYRLAKDGLATRTGWDWQFKPESIEPEPEMELETAEETATHAEEVPAGDTAGEFNEA